MRGYFITGTDTGVGKTFVTTALARRAVESGRRVFAFKPIETGVAPLTNLEAAPMSGDPSNVRLGEDQRALVEAAGGWQTGELRGLYQFELPAAPSVAAAAEGRRVNIGEIDRVFSIGGMQSELVLVEGAGGWRVPITESVDMGAFAKRLGLPVLIVARAGLGTINHSLLTIEAVERQGCTVAALILSVRPDDDVEFAQSNAEQIGLAWPGPVILLRAAKDLDVLI